MSKTAGTDRTRTSRTTSKTRSAAPAGRGTAKKGAAQAAAPKRRSTRLPADLKLAIAAAQEKLAIDLTVLDLRNATAFTDFFVVCTGSNTKQVQAIADSVESRLRAAGQKPALVEGYSRGEWVLLDYFTFIVHIFLPTRRSFYALERLWGGAEPIEVSAP